jgi:hypothetical protein
MTRGPNSFKQGDVTRAVRAVRAAGVPVVRVEVERDGKIVVIVGEAEKNASADREDLLRLIK